MGVWSETEERSVAIELPPAQVLRGEASAVEERTSEGPRPREHPGVLSNGERYTGPRTV